MLQKTVGKLENANICPVDLTLSIVVPRHKCSSRFVVLYGVSISITPR